MTKGKQKGIAVLMVVIVIALSISVYYFSSISIIDIKADKQQKTRIALQQAKTALLAYAKLRADISIPSSQSGKYGYLPCPANTNGDGNSVGSCGGVNKNYLGWFPWRSLGMPALKDGNGDCLLYVVSSTYKFNPIAGMLNEDATYGMLQVVDENNTDIHGAVAQDRAVAIIFSAGSALSGQVRNKDSTTECGNDKNNFNAYLDEYEVSPGDVVRNWEVDTFNANKVDRFVKAASAENEEVFNDQLIVITQDEVWPAVVIHREEEFDIADISGASNVRRLTEALARCLASYANDNDNSRLPLPVLFSLNDYRNNDEYDDDVITSASHIGRYPFITNDADTAIPGSITNVSDNYELFKKDFVTENDCNSLNIASPSGIDADLRTINSKDRHLWENWKDHIVYVVSQNYGASAIPATDPGAPRCGNCVTYNGGKYAAIVIYSASRLAALGQVREAPIATIDVGIVTDTKQFLSNYIEVVNPVGNGMGDYSPTADSNDLFFCLTDDEPIDVIECI